MLHASAADSISGTVDVLSTYLVAIAVISGIPILLWGGHALLRLFLEAGYAPLPDPRTIEREKPAAPLPAPEPVVTHHRVDDHRTRVTPDIPSPFVVPVSLAKVEPYQGPTDVFRSGRDPRRGPCPHCGARIAGYSDDRRIGGPCCYAFATDAVFGS